jgi:ubiquitin carboxyl-terminal hydrolase 5/13
MFICEMESDCPHLEEIINLPRSDIRIYKDECAYCFASARSENGLFVCLNCLASFCHTHAKLHLSKKQHTVFLQIKFIAKTKNEIEAGYVVNDAGEKKPSKLGIGVLGGFDVNKFLRYNTESAVHCLGCADMCGFDLFDIDTTPYPVCTVYL